MSVYVQILEDITHSKRGITAGQNTHFARYVAKRCDFLTNQLAIALFFYADPALNKNLIVLHRGKSLK